MTSPYTTDLPVGRDRFLFLDDAHVQRARNVRRNFHSLRRLRDKPLIVPDCPTDLVTVYLYGTVLRDRRNRSMHMWYHAQRSRRDGFVFRVCYARSTDGLQWSKPAVGEGEIDGTTRHNVVANSYPVDGDAFSPGINVIHCPDEPDPATRFRRITQAREGTFVSGSPDGLRWSPAGERAFKGSDAATVVYDMLNRRYIAVSIADVQTGAFMRRTPTVATSPDFHQWSDFHIAFQCDELDDRLVRERLERRRAILSYGDPAHFHEEVNNMFCFNYADLILAAPIMFDCCGYDAWKGTPGGRGSARDDAPMHIQLAWCRDDRLRTWHRPLDREPLLPISEPPRWDCGCQALAESPVRMGDELWFYYSGSPHSQQHPSYTLEDGWRYRQGELPGGISVATLRLDGFASLDADRQGGEVVTMPFRFEGDRITINAVSYHGLDVEVLDEADTVISGYDAEACLTIKGDSVRHELQFKDVEMAALRGRTMKLRFHLYGTMLFAFH